MPDTGTLYPNDPAKPDPAPKDRGLTPEFWSLVDLARQRKRERLPLENRWYDDKPGQKYRTSDTERD